ncbi:hypothetical protein B9G53_18545 [Pseudanabaena sp. SR411]|uniref:C1 family peptidase n=1 Tax=Pseudanabaena sp. SR411 TaxID=1980935 RepID=UPI000B9878B9|nr:C1 family peptidase [Pseudanabaena sp. SR411]OYQ63144.1 hypothetical protein B9G53_18545 [Pseudanabaena sp. SR411]
MSDYLEFRDYPYIDAILKLIGGEIDFGLWYPEKSDELVVLSSKDKAREKLEQSSSILVPLNENICTLGKSKTKTSIDVTKLKHFESEAKDWSPIEDQIHAATCTAAAGVSLLEYFQRKESGVYQDLSKRFLYTVTRKLMRDEILVGATVRQTIAAMALFGVPPERYWQYKPEALNEEPDAFCYGLAKNYRATSYIRLDRPKKSAEDLLKQIKVFVTAGYPVMFGMWGYESLLKQSRYEVHKTEIKNESSETEEEKIKGIIPFPEKHEKCIGSHALIAVGFEDDKVIKNGFSQDSKPTTGAFKIRNSWGIAWGEDGYGWLPYDYVLRGLTFDWWSILKAEYIDTTIFSLIENEHMIPRDVINPPPKKYTG